MPSDKKAGSSARPDLSRDRDHDGDVDLADDLVNDLDHDGDIDLNDRENNDIDNDQDIDHADHALEAAGNTTAASVGESLGWKKDQTGWKNPDTSMQQKQSLGQKGPQ